MRNLILAGVLCASSVSAHEFTELDVAGFSVTDAHIAVQIQDTVGERGIICATFGADGGLLGSNSWITDNLATRVVIRRTSDVVPVRAQCVFND